MEQKLLQVRPMHAPTLPGVEPGFVSTLQGALDERVRHAETLREVAVCPGVLPDGGETTKHIDVGRLQYMASVSSIDTRYIARRVRLANESKSDRFHCYD